jgi:cytochrome b subunit of formate dehydrogenase
LNVQIVGLSRFGKPFNYQQTGSKFVILMTMVIIIIIIITPIIIILSCLMQAGQHPQKVALGLKTAFCDSQISWLSSLHMTLVHAFGRHTIANAVQTQPARSVNSSSFI